MEILSKLISEKSTELVSSLVNSGFTKEQAENFLPEAGKSVISTIGSERGLNVNNVSNLLASGQIASLMEQIDITDLASKTGLDALLIYNGFNSLLSTLMDLLKHNGSGNMLGDVQNLILNETWH